LNKSYRQAASSAYIPRSALGSSYQCVFIRRVSDFSFVTGGAALTIWLGEVARETSTVAAPVFEYVVA